VTDQPVAIRSGLRMPEGRRRVLYALRRRGEATAADLADQLAMTVSGARQHLTALVDDGLVDAHEVSTDQPRRGRPTLAYSVTAIGDDEFPRAYGELTTELLGFLQDEQPEALERLFERRRDQRIANAHRRLDRLGDLEAKVDELTRILDEDGYFATWEPIEGGGFRIIEHNCAIWAVAQRFGQACTSEIDFISDALGDAVIERTHHMASGESHCAYEIRPTGPVPPVLSRV
jgi:DeoR family suf operon transcriptional repressor